MLEEVNMPETTEAIDFLRALVESKPGGEHRPEQERMTNAVAHAIKESEHLLVQSGTGTGKTLGYAAAVAVSGKRAVISTATKQLSEQIVDKDLPVLSKEFQKQFDRPLRFALLKGRDNYLCLKKINELKNLDNDAPQDLSSALDDKDDEKAKPLFRVKSSGKKGREVDMTEEYAAIYEWERTTKTGDRSHAPAVSDKVWSGVSISNADCPGRNSCPFGQECFAEKAREKARTVDIVVTNHALVGADMETGSLLGERDVLVADELHELDSYLSSAWGAELHGKNLFELAGHFKKANSAMGLKENVEKATAEIEKQAETLVGLLTDADPQRYTEGLPEEFSGPLNAVRAAIMTVVTETGKFQANNELPAPKKSALTAAEGRGRSLLEDLDLLTTNDGSIVQWSERPWTPKADDRPPLQLKAAPLRIGPRLMRELEETEMTFIGTSATITVAGKFDIPARNLSLGEKPEDGSFVPRAFSALDTGTPFNYARQGIMYVPDSNNFPAPIGKERFEHTEAVKEFATRALRVSGGRGLMLSTTTRGAKEIGEHLRNTLDTPVLIQGEAPPAQLVEEFKADEEATLVATMGMWHGLDAPGPTLSLVIIDKIPFRPMDDPLMNARQEDVAARGGNGFMDVYVAEANVMLAQGVGRLIRHTQDRGIVAILDTRLRTKAYGKAMMRSLPPMYLTSSEEQVYKSLGNL